MKTVISEYESETLLFDHIVYTNPQEKDFELHTHDICELLFLKKGEVSAIIGAKEYKLQKDSLAIFRANTAHKIKINKKADYERYDIIFDESILANRIFKKISPDFDIISYSGNRRISDLFARLDDYCRFFKNEDLKILVTNITEELLFNIYLTPKNNLNENIPLSNPIITKALQYINDRYEEPISVGDVCSFVCTTKSHLHQLFMRYLKTTPKKYINQKRLSKAQELIKSGEKPSVIYSLCGFAEYATFFRNYTAYFGYTPSEREKIAVEREIKS